VKEDFYSTKGLKETRPAFSKKKKEVKTWLLVNKSGNPFTETPGSLNTQRAPNLTNGVETFTSVLRDNHLRERTNLRGGSTNSGYPKLLKARVGGLWELNQLARKKQQC